VQLLQLFSPLSAVTFEIYRSLPLIPFVMTECYDLHCHSTASDGVLTPTALVQRAADCGVTALALTDHDTIAGLLEAQQQADLLDMRRYRVFYQLAK
jgi:hypothetical protein